MKAIRVLPIQAEQAYPLILSYHYAHRIPCITHAFGAFNESMELIGCVTYGIPASYTLCEGIAGKENKDKVLELNRLVIKPNVERKNLASFIVGKSLKMLPRHLIIVSYADTAMGHIGYVYQATNFMHTGMSAKRTDPVSEGGIHPRHIKCEEGLARKERSQKHRYVYVTGNDKALARSIKYGRKPYPKGNNKRYEINFDTNFSLT